MRTQAGRVVNRECKLYRPFCTGLLRQAPFVRIHDRGTRSDQTIREILHRDVIIRIQGRDTYDMMEYLLEIVTEAVTTVWPTQIFVLGKSEPRLLASTRTLLIYLYESDNDGFTGHADGHPADIVSEARAEAIADRRLVGSHVERALPIEGSMGLGTLRRGHHGGVARRAALRGGASFSTSSTWTTRDSPCTKTVSIGTRTRRVTFTATR